MFKLHGGYVDGDRRARRPGHRLAAGLLEGPFTDRDDQSGILGERDEVARGYVPALGMMPPQQRLKPSNLPARRVHRRLVMKRQLAVRECLPQVELKRLPRDRRGVHGRLVEAKGVPALVLGPVERHVGALEELVATRPVLRSERNPDADAQLDWVA